MYKRFQALKKAFQEFDQDGNKYIDKQEFRAALQVLGMDVSEAETDAIFSVFHTSASGGLRYNEFVRLVAASGHDNA